MAGRTKQWDEQEIIWSLQRGEEYGFTAIFSQFYAPLVIYAARITGDQAAAEDVVEEGFISFWKKRDVFSEIRSLKSYLYTIVRNGCLAWIKKNNRQLANHKGLSELEEEFGKTVLENMIYAETLSKIYAAMDKLPKQCKKVFILHYIEGKKIAEIAKELNISIVTVKTHKGRGISLLQKALLAFMISAFLF